MKSLDKILGVIGKLPGRNVRERIGGLETHRTLGAPGLKLIEIW